MSSAVPLVPMGSVAGSQPPTLQPIAESQYAQHHNAEGIRTLGGCPLNTVDRNSATTQPVAHEQEVDSAHAIMKCGGYKLHDPWGLLLSEHHSIKGIFPSLSITVGRAAHCDVCLDDARVSAVHFIISIDAEVHLRELPQRAHHSPPPEVPRVCAYLTDHSTNGTFVNDTRVRKGHRVELRNGDDITIVRLPEKRTRHATEEDESTGRNPLPPSASNGLGGNEVAGLTSLPTADAKSDEPIGRGLPACQLAALLGSLPTTRNYLERFCFHCYLSATPEPSPHFAAVAHTQAVTTSDEEAPLLEMTPNSLYSKDAAVSGAIQQHPTSLVRACPAILLSPKVTPPLITNGSSTTHLHHGTTAGSLMPHGFFVSVPGVPLDGPLPSRPASASSHVLTPAVTSFTPGNRLLQDNCKRLSMSSEEGFSVARRSVSRVPAVVCSGATSGGLGTHTTPSSSGAMATCTVMPSRELQWGHRVGAGASGDVYMGIDVASGMVIAIKVFKGTSACQECYGGKDAAGSEANNEYEGGDGVGSSSDTSSSQRTDGHGHKKRRVDPEDTILTVVSAFSSPGSPTTPTAFTKVIDRVAADDDGDSRDSSLTAPGPPIEDNSNTLLPRAVSSSRLELQERSEERDPKSADTHGNRGSNSNSATRKSLESNEEMQTLGVDERCDHDNGSSKASHEKKVGSSHATRVSVVNGPQLVVGRGKERRLLSVPARLHPSHLRELWLLTQLKNHRIVRCLGFQSDVKRGLCILMEYVAGGTLSALIKSFGAFEENVIRLYTVQILEGLEYLASVHVVHGDLKCANVLVSERGNVKLTDFGTSRIQREYAGVRCSQCGLQRRFYQYASPAGRSPVSRVSSSQSKVATALGDAECQSNDDDDIADTESPCRCRPHASDPPNAFLCGTPLYMSPELIRTQQSTTASDIWALGCIVFEMATGGILPWRAVHQSDAMAIIYYIGSRYEEGPSFQDVYSARAHLNGQRGGTSHREESVSDGGSRGCPRIGSYEEGPSEGNTGGRGRTNPTTPSPAFMDFLTSIFVMDPSRRPTASDLLRHPFITGEVETKRLSAWHHSVGMLTNRPAMGSERDVVNGAKGDEGEAHPHLVPLLLMQAAAPDRDARHHRPHGSGPLLWSTEEWAALREEDGSYPFSSQAEGPPPAEQLSTPSPLLLGASCSSNVLQPLSQPVVTSEVTEEEASGVAPDSQPPSISAILEDDPAAPLTRESSPPTCITQESHVLMVTPVTPCEPRGNPPPYNQQLHYAYHHTGGYQPPLQRSEPPSMHPLHRRQSMMRSHQAYLRSQELSRRKHLSPTTITPASTRGPHLRNRCLPRTQPHPSIRDIPVLCDDGKWSQQPVPMSAPAGGGVCRHGGSNAMSDAMLGAHYGYPNTQEYHYVSQANTQTIMVSVPRQANWRRPAPSPRWKNVSLPPSASGHHLSTHSVMQPLAVGGSPRSSPSTFANAARTTSPSVGIFPDCPPAFILNDGPHATVLPPSQACVVSPSTPLLARGRPPCSQAATGTSPQLRPLSSGMTTEFAQMGAIQMSPPTLHHQSSMCRSCGRGVLGAVDTPYQQPGAGNGPPSPQGAAGKEATASNGAQMSNGEGPPLVSFLLEAANNRTSPANTRPVKSSLSKFRKQKRGLLRKKLKGKQSK